MKPNFLKLDGLLPVVVQHFATKQVLMLGFMNAEAWDQTLETKQVTFFSRSKQRLWTKGETSGNFLNVKSITLDCDSDTALIQADPVGPTCHTGEETCFKEDQVSSICFLETLAQIIKDRKENETEKSYTSELFKAGRNKIAQKVGEEAVETVIEALNGTPERLLEESADLLYHLLVLFEDCEISLSEVVAVLEKRNTKQS